MRPIDADILKETITENFLNPYERNHIHDLIDIQPTADVQEVKHGKWIKDERERRDDGEIYDYCCSLCKGQAVKGEYNNNDLFTDFCPHCGAKMDL